MGLRGSEGSVGSHCINCMFGSRFHDLGQMLSDDTKEAASRQWLRFLRDLAI